MQFDHLAIQVPHERLENTIQWYIDFFDCRRKWQQSSDFQPLTRKRLPGIQSIVELDSSFFRFHLFSRKVTEEIVDHYIQYHHIGFSVSAPHDIPNLQKKWTSLFESGRYTFVDNTYVTEHIIDDIGIESTYFTDVNGLEYEVTYVPEERNEIRTYPHAQ